MRTKLASLILLVLAVSLTLTAVGAFVLSMLTNNRDLLPFALSIAAGATAMFVVYQVKQVNAEQRKVEEFMARTRANDPYTIRIS